MGMGTPLPRALLLIGGDQESYLVLEPRLRIVSGLPTIRPEYDRRERYTCLAPVYRRAFRSPFENVACSKEENRINECAKLMGVWNMAVSVLDVFQVCARAPATGKNATPHRNIFNSRNSVTFTTRAAT
jgi:hypothetical protein